ncbi:hypothetical protein O181_082274 [Austropuccinia psidii MF-1]|uniref:Uncharacterized protein n=1 Tax=Austropuccinia psidii MF-1 TaxID=1389203 RepID=A0A9Q3IKW2_9BASI|nr:hypothetical protein [Austropuccinia psidii MF-1]
MVFCAEAPQLALQFLHALTTPSQSSQSRANDPSSGSEILTMSTNASSDRSQASLVSPDLLQKMEECSAALQPFNASASSNIQNGLTRRELATFQGKMAKTLDHMLGVYSKLMTKAAEDRLMDEEIQKLRAYLRRVQRNVDLSRSRAEVDRGPARRFVSQGTANLKSLDLAPKRARLSEAQIEEKIRKGKESDKVELPQIRQVIKASNNDHKVVIDCDEDDSNEGQDDDLKIYVD